MALTPLDLQGKIALEEGLSLRDLLNLGEATFSVKDSPVDGAYENYEPAENVFDPDTLLKSVNMEALNLGEDHSSMPFEAIKQKMFDVTSNGSVKKKVLKEGIGEIMPPDSLVTIHYDAYLEFNEVPFDSSTLRGKPEVFILGASGVVPGLDIAVSTMREREKSQFLLSPSVAFGSIGCPPRIPPSAEMLFVVEVMRWRVGSEAAVARATAIEGESKWDTCHMAFRGLMKEGIALYKDCKFKDSKIRLEKAKRLIENCSLKNEEEEAERNRCMFKVSINLSMVFNELTGSSSYAPAAIVNAKEALVYQPNNPKAHLQWGRALINLGELDKARRHLAEAKRQLPSDISVTDAWEKLEKKKKKEQEEERRVWKKAFRLAEETSDNKEVLSPEAKDFAEQLQAFAQNVGQSSLTLPGGLTAKEKADVEAIANTLNLKLTVRSKSILITRS